MLQLEALLKEDGKEITSVLNFAVDDEVVKERIGGRWIHKASGRSYHVKFAPPKASQTCIHAYVQTHSCCGRTRPVLPVVGPPRSARLRQQLSLLPSHGRGGVLVVVLALCCWVCAGGGQGRRHWRAPHAARRRQARDGRRPPQVLPRADQARARLLRVSYVVEAEEEGKAVAAVVGW